MAHLRRDRDALAEHHLHAANVALAAVADNDVAVLDAGARVQLCRNQLPQLWVP